MGKDEDYHYCLAALSPFSRNSSVAHPTPQRIHMYFGLPDPDPLVRVMDPDPDTSIIMQK
jgi:hypothetical protein